MLRRPARLLGAWRGGTVHDQHEGQSGEGETGSPGPCIINLSEQRWMMLDDDGRRGHSCEESSRGGAQCVSTHSRLSSRSGATKGEDLTADASLLNGGARELSFALSGLIFARLAMQGQTSQKLAFPLRARTCAAIRDRPSLPADATAAGQPLLLAHLPATVLSTRIANGKARAPTPSPLPPPPPSQPPRPRSHRIRCPCPQPYPPGAGHLRRGERKANPGRARRRPRSLLCLVPLQLSDPAAAAARPARGALAPLARRRGAGPGRPAAPGARLQRPLSPAETPCCSSRRGQLFRPGVSERRRAPGAAAGDVPPEGIRRGPSAQTPWGGAPGFLPRSPPLRSAAALPRDLDRARRPHATPRPRARRRRRRTSSGCSWSPSPTSAASTAARRAGTTSAPATWRAHTRRAPPLRALRAACRVSRRCERAASAPAGCHPQAMQCTQGWDWTIPVPDRNTGVWGDVRAPLSPLHTRVSRSAATASLQCLARCGALRDHLAARRPPAGDAPPDGPRPDHGRPRHPHGPRGPRLAGRGGARGRPRDGRREGRARVPDRGPLGAGPPRWRLKTPLAARTRTDPLVFARQCPGSAGAGGFVLAGGTAAERARGRGVRRPPSVRVRQPAERAGAGGG